MKNARTSPPFSGLTEGYSGPRSKAWDVTDRATRMDNDGADIIHLGVGDPDFDTPAGIVDRAVTSLKSARTHYSPISGEPELRNAVAEACSYQYGTDIKAAQVCIFPGAQCALFATMLCLAGPGDEVILLEPFYATYEGVAQAGGATMVTVALSADDDFSLNIDRIADAVTDKTRVILMNSPGNPSGTVFDQKSIESLAQLCRDKNIWLVSDEVYSQLIFDVEHYSPLSIPQARDNVIVICSVSKSFAMTGWRLGWTIAPPELTSHLSNLSQCLLFGVSQFTQDAVAYALRNEHQQVATFCNIFKQRRDMFCDALENIDSTRLRFRRLRQELRTHRISMRRKTANGRRQSNKEIRSPPHYRIKRIRRSNRLLIIIFSIKSFRALYARLYARCRLIRNSHPTRYSHGWQN